MVTYNFTTIEDFVLYLDIRAKEMRVKQARLHNRTHEHAALQRGAAEIESVAAMVRSSNLTVLSEQDLAVLHYKRRDTFLKAKS